MIATVAHTALPTRITLDNDPAEHTEHDTYLRVLLQQVPAGLRVTDVHLREGEPPALVINDRIVRVDGEDVPKDVIIGIIGEFSAHAKKRFEQELDADGRITRHDGSVLRVHAMRHSPGLALTIRLQPPRPFRWDEMGLPDHLLDVVERDQGLVIFTGPVGSRKTSALHALLDHVNRNHAPKHILTIEDPPEFSHEPINALFTQREIGHTTPTYEAALMGALRVRPNIVVVGEARDAATIQASILASKLGRLALTSMHAETATEIPHRIEAAFPPGQRDEVVAAFEETFVAIVALRLVPTVDGGVTLAYEILRNTQATRNMMKGDPVRLRGEMEQHGDTMMLMEVCLKNLHDAGRIDVQTALTYAPDQVRMKQLIGYAD